MLHEEQAPAKLEAREETAGCQNVFPRSAAGRLSAPWLLTESPRPVVLGGSQTSHSNVSGGVIRRPTLSRS